MIDPTMIVAGIAGLCIAVGSILKAMKEQQPMQPRYAIAGNGYAQTQYVPQAPSQAYIPYVPPVPQYQAPIQQYQQPIPVPQPVEPYKSVYPWGYNAYIASIANTQTVPSQYTTSYYPNTYMVDGVMHAPCTIMYNTDYHRGDTLNQLTSVQGRAAPPGYTFGHGFNPTMNPLVPTTSYPWSSSGNPYTSGFGSTFNGGYTNPYRFGPCDNSQQCLYNFDIPLSATVVRQPQSVAPATVRTYPDGSQSFCRIPSCYNDNGSWRY